VAEHWRGEIGLAGDPTSAREARAFVRMALGDRVSADVLQDVLLVASEVVTNAIRHARTPLTVNLEIHSDTVRVVVTDGAVPFGNRVTGVDDDAESGRGMGIVAAICSAWGMGDTPIGKSIWAEIPIS
jgi:anti-sigma regulatory factor (Ser/Thr protein kinase)